MKKSSFRALPALAALEFFGAPGFSQRKDELPPDTSDKVEDHEREDLQPRESALPNEPRKISDQPA